jgi:anti-anti-sigma factor
VSDKYQHISVSSRGEVIVLVITDKRIEQHEAATRMSTELIDAVEVSQAKDFVLDMGNLEFISSVGYLPFLRLAKCVNDLGGRLLLANMPEIVAEIFTATRLLI